MTNFLVRSDTNPQQRHQSDQSNQPITTQNYCRREGHSQSNENWRVWPKTSLLMKEVYFYLRGTSD